MCYNQETLVAAGPVVCQCPRMQCIHMNVVFMRVDLEKLLMHSLIQVNCFLVGKKLSCTNKKERNKSFSFCFSQMDDGELVTSLSELLLANPSSTSYFSRSLRKTSDIPPSHNATFVLEKAENHRILFKKLSNF